MFSVFLLTCNRSNFVRQYEIQNGFNTFYQHLTNFNDLATHKGEVFALIGWSSTEAARLTVFGGQACAGFDCLLTTFDRFFQYH